MTQTISRSAVTLAVSIGAVDLGHGRVAINKDGRWFTGNPYLCGSPMDAGGDDVVRYVDEMAMPIFWSPKAPFGTLDLHTGKIVPDSIQNRGEAWLAAHFPGRYVRVTANVYTGVIERATSALTHTTGAYDDVASE